MTEINPQSFRGGMPYEPDVSRLMETFPVLNLKEGQVISHEELEKILKYKHGSQRYYGVINSWAKKIESENDIVLEWKLGIGLKVLLPHERLQSSEGKIKRGIKATKRGISSLSRVQRERLDEAGKQRYDHIGRASLMLKNAVDAAKNQLKCELPAVKSLPKPNRQ